MALQLGNPCPAGVRYTNIMAHLQQYKDQDVFIKGNVAKEKREQRLAAKRAKLGPAAPLPQDPVPLAEPERALEPRETSAPGN